MAKHYTLFILLLFGLATSFAQTTHTETFTNIPANASNYTTREWTGDNTKTWQATDARTDQQINGSRAITVRNGSLKCMGISGGISSISFDQEQEFGGSGGKLEIYINGDLKGTSNPTTTADNFSLTNINVSGTFDLEIRQVTSGLRISIDNLSWTEYNAAPCVKPTSAPTNLSLVSSPVTVTGTFTPASPAADGYIVVRSTSATLTQSPVDGTRYTEGETLGNGVVARLIQDNRFTDGALNPNTTYYYFIFSMNDEDCSGGPAYFTAANLTGTIATETLPPCVKPEDSITNLALTPSNNSVSGEFTASDDANQYLIIIAPDSVLSQNPVNGMVYQPGDALGGGTVVKYSNTLNFVAAGLQKNTNYYLLVFAANNECSGGEPFYSTFAVWDSVHTSNSASGIPAGYYDGTDGLTCGALKTKLRDIISNAQVLSYTPGVWQAYQYTDIHRNDANTSDIIWDMYSDNPNGPEPYTYTYQLDQCGNYSKEGDCYNREHSTPKSWFASAEPMYTDVHHLFPTDGKVNAIRSNYPFGEVLNATETSLNGSKLGTGNNFGYTGIVFEPIDEYKGDFARAGLYMATRYENEIISQNWSANGNADQLFLSPTDQPDVNKRKAQIYDDWFVKLLFKWINDDPVSQKEIDRNNAIYYESGQGNRNPFVDRPELAFAAWQCSGLLPVTITDFVAARKNDGVLLKWYATYEMNFAYFEVMRSENGSNFYTIGKIQGNNLANYYFNDEQLPEGAIVYYRLKMVDKDGKADYSKVVSVRLNNNFSNAIVYPNPASGTLHIKLDKKLEANSILQIVDVSGRVVKKEMIRMPVSYLNENVSNLRDGRYIIKIQSAGQVITSSFVIMR